jgi:hypothetical protein
VSTTGSVRSSLLMSSDTRGWMGADEEGIRADRPTKIVCNRIRQESSKAIIAILSKTRSRRTRARL